MELVIECKTYPNETKYLEFKIGERQLGCAVEVEEGYLVWNKRKPQPTIREAAIQMLNDRLKWLEKEKSDWCEIRRVVLALKEKP